MVAVVVSRDGQVPERQQGRRAGLGPASNKVELRDTGTHITVELSTSTSPKGVLISLGPSLPNSGLSAMWSDPANVYGK